MKIIIGRSLSELREIESALDEASLSLPDGPAADAVRVAWSRLSGWVSDSEEMDVSNSVDSDVRLWRAIHFGVSAKQLRRFCRYCDFPGPDHRAGCPGEKLATRPPRSGVRFKTY